MGFDRFFF